MNRSDWRSGRPLLICYAALGDPLYPEDALAIYARHGVDIVEVGIPTENPLLDGPTVAGSMRRSLAGHDPIGTIRGRIREQAASIRDRLKLVLMGYRDMRFDQFTAEVRDQLIHGLIMADTADEAASPELTDWLSREAVKRIGFVDSGLSPHLVARARNSQGYVMLQAHQGPTGVRAALDMENRHRLLALRSAQVNLPIALGFGIGTPEQAAQAIDMGADGVVVGSACIEAGRRGGDALASLVTQLRAAIDHRSAAAARG